MTFPGRLPRPRAPGPAPQAGARPSPALPYRGAAGGRRRPGGRGRRGRLQLPPPPPRSVLGRAGLPLPRRRAGARAPEAGGAAALGQPGWERAGPALKGRSGGERGRWSRLRRPPGVSPSAPSPDSDRGEPRPLPMRGAPGSVESPGQGAAPGSSAGGRGRRDCAQLRRPGPFPSRLEAGAAPKSALVTASRTRAAPAGTPTRKPCAS